MTAHKHNPGIRAINKEKGNQPADHGGHNGEMSMENQEAKNEALIGGSGLNAGLEAFPDKKISPRKAAKRKKLLRAVCVAEAELLHCAMTHGWKRNHKSLSAAAVGYSNALGAHHASL